MHRRAAARASEACDKAVVPHRNGKKHPSAVKPKCWTLLYKRFSQFRTKKGVWIALLVSLAVIALVLQYLPPISLLMRVPFMNRFDFNKKFRRNYWKYYVPVLSWNPIYRIPESHERLGDRTDRYVSLRKEVDAQLDDPVVFAQQLSILKSSRHSFETVSSFDDSYNPYNCPDQPPEGYPFLWKTVDILQAWNPKDLKVPPQIHHSLCVFDFSRDYHKAMNYRAAKLPFVVVNDPAVTKTTVRWSLPNYLNRLFEKHGFHPVRSSKTARFLYFDEQKWSNEHRKTASRLKGTTTLKESASSGNDNEPPTKVRAMTFDEFVRLAGNATAPEFEETHWYLKTGACGWEANDGTCLHPTQGHVEFYYDEMPFFQPHVHQPSNELYQHVDRKNDAVGCRYAQKGIIYEPHFDGAPNTLLLLQGSRRYILAPPRDCSNLALYPRDHSSARFSTIDWSDPNLEQFPEFAQSQSLELVMHAGEALILPSNWFHYIISLEFNAHCNVMSSRAGQDQTDLAQCGYQLKD